MDHVPTKEINLIILYQAQTVGLKYLFQTAMFYFL